MQPGQFLVPAHATTQAPPETGADQVAVFAAGAWAVQPDFRGRIYWTPEGVEVEISAIGETVPADALDAAPPPPAEPRFLTPPQFEFLLALTGFGEVWDALADAAKAQGDMATFAALRAERVRSRFLLDVVLSVVDRFRDQAAQIAPEVDLSEAAIMAAWDQAEVYGGLQ